MSKLKCLKDLGRRIDGKLGILPIHAPSTVLTVLTFSPLILLTPLAYAVWGCQTDWVAVAGFAIDIFGALILAIPDLPKYSEWAYGGRVREAHLRLMHDETPGRIAPDTRYYDAFTEALREKLLPSHVPENAWFDIDRIGNSYDLMIKDENLDPTGVGPISIGNIERDLTSVYRSEDGKFRRIGILLLVIGFLIQILSMVFDKFFFIDLCTF